MGRVIYHTSTQLFIIPVAYFLYAYPSWWIAPGIMLSFIMGVYGFSIGMHHTFTHTTFSFPRTTEKALAILSTLTMLVPPIDWSATHVEHHRFTDTEKDPHSKKNPQFTSEWKRYLFYFHGSSTARPLRRLVRDSFQKWLRKNYWLVILSHPLLAFLVGGVNGLVYLWMLPITYVNFVIIVLNTFAHSGSFNGKNNATNNLFMKLVTIGDGNHIQHHEDSSVGELHHFFANRIGNVNRAFSISR